MSHSALTEMQPPPSLHKLQKACIQASEGYAGALHETLAAFTSLDTKIDETNKTVMGCRREVEKIGARVNVMESKITEAVDKIENRFVEEAKKTEAMVDSVRTEMMESVNAVAKECEDQVSKVKAGQKENTKKIGAVTGQITQAITKIKQMAKKQEEGKKQLLERVDKGLKKAEKMIKTEVTRLDEEIDEFKEEATGKIDDLEKRFSEYRFETDIAIAKKADIEDLRPKMDKTDFKKFKACYDVLEKTTKEREDKIEDTVDRNAESIGDVCKKQERDLQQANLEIQQLREELQQLKENKNEDMISGIIAQLQLTFQEDLQQTELRLRKLIAQSQGGGQMPAASTSTGNCFSCGRPSPAGLFSPMPAPKAIISPKRGAAGGFNGGANKYQRSRSQIISSAREHAGEHHDTPMGSMSKQRRASGSNLASLRDPVHGAPRTPVGKATAEMAAHHLPSNVGNTVHGMTGVTQSSPPTSRPSSGVAKLL